MIHQSGDDTKGEICSGLVGTPDHGRINGGGAKSRIIFISGHPLIVAVRHAA